MLRRDFIRPDGAATLNFVRPGYARIKTNSRYRPKDHFLDPATNGKTRDILVFIIGSPKIVIVLWGDESQPYTDGREAK